MRPLITSFARPAVPNVSPSFARSERSCTITRVSNIVADGQIETLVGKKDYETAVRAKLIVQRDEAVMVENFVSNAGWRVNVIDPGSAQGGLLGIISNKNMATARKARLVRLGFTHDEAERLSALHTCDFM